MKNRIRVAAIIVEGDKILLVKHVDPDTGHAWWVPPGGGIEVQDTNIFDCAIREVFEETNLKVTASKIAYLREFLDVANDQLNFEVFVVVDAYSGEISMQNLAGAGPDDQYVKDVAWLTKEELQDKVVYPEILKDGFWEDYKEGFVEVKYLGRQGE